MMNWFLFFWAVLIMACIARMELRDECEQHGKNIGKTMTWNVFGGCEETRR